jgi:hypothetical protein
VRIILQSGLPDCRINILSEIMPELPEVETTVAGLRSVLEGQVLTLVEPRRADLRFPLSAGPAASG